MDSESGSMGLRAAQPATHAIFKRTRSNLRSLGASSPRHNEISGSPNSESTQRKPNGLLLFMSAVVMLSLMVRDLLGLKVKVN